MEIQSGNNFNKLMTIGSIVCSCTLLDLLQMCVMENALRVIKLVMD